MKELRWDLSKNQELKSKRGVSFEEIIHARLVTVMKHPKRAGQNIMMFEYQDYIWIVPYVEDHNELFLKTLFPSRKCTKLWKEGKL